MDLRRDQEEIYRKTLAEARNQIEEIDIQIEDQINLIKARLQELQTSKKAMLGVCESLSKILGEDVAAEDLSAVPSLISRSPG